MSEAVQTVRTPQDPAAAPAGGVVLIGNPNVGKSALFGALTRSYVTVSNYPGTTVEIAAGKMTLGGRSVVVRDTPGAYGFTPSSEDERVTRDILLQDGTGTVLVVGDAKDLTRTLTLVVQLAEMELPGVLCLNMMDEAAERGIKIDHEALGDILGIEVVPAVAIRNRGVRRLRGALQKPAIGTVSVRYPQDIEDAVERIGPRLPSATISARALALMVLAGDETLVAWLRARMDREELSAIEDVRQELRRQFREPLLYVINQARSRTASELADRVIELSTRDRVDRRTAVALLERATIHPIWSVPVLAAVLYVAYLFVGVFGAGTLVDWMENGAFGKWINPAATRLVERTVPWPLFRDLLVGPYGLITMALTYSLALILPIVGTFFLAFGVLEDSGYLPRLAVVLNKAFKKIGLNGKAVLPMVLGLGCDTMATLTTRILETRKERLIVILLLSLGVPCSAQLTVIMAMLASISALTVGIWIAVVLAVIVLVGALASKILPGRGSDFIVELPPLRIPKLSNIVLKTVARVEWYLKEAVPLFLLGTFVLFVTDRTGVLEWLRVASEPVVSGLLGLPKEAAEAFLIGFLRRDFGAAGLYRMNEAGQLDAVQVLVAAVTITLFIPCIAQLFMVIKERGWRTGLAIAAFVFPFALAVGTVLNHVLRAFGGFPLPR